MRQELGLQWLSGLPQEQIHMCKQELLLLVLEFQGRTRMQVDHKRQEPELQ